MFLRKCRTKDNRKRLYNFTSGSNEDGPVSKRQNLVSLIEDDGKGEHSGKFSVYNVNESDELIWCEVGGVSVEMLIDSGSMYNLIDDQTWECMKRNGVRI